MLTLPNQGQRMLHYEEEQWINSVPTEWESLIEEWGSINIDTSSAGSLAYEFTYNGTTYTYAENARSLSPDVTDIYPS